MNKKTGYFTLLLIVIFSVSCGTTDKKIRADQPAPSEKRQSNHLGKVLITEITDSKDDPAGDNSGYVNIYFNFIPADPGAAGKYLCPACSDSRRKLFYDNRDSFHKTWVNKWEIKTGKEYKAVRHELYRKNKYWMHDGWTQRR